MQVCQTSLLQVVEIALCESVPNREKECSIDADAFFHSFINSM